MEAAAKWGALPPLAAAVLEDPDTGVLVFDGESRLRHATARAAEVLGLRKGALLEGLLTPDLLALADLDEASAACAGLTFLSGKAETLKLHSRDRLREIQMRVRHVGDGFQVASLSERGGAVEEFALRDSLTGLASRRYFENAVAAVLAQETPGPFAVLLLDLDRFKPVNDTLGHAAGDAVLQLASERLKAAVRRHDVVARFGGDEFAVLMNPTPEAKEAERLARRILDLVQRTYLIDGNLVNIGTSIGIAMAPEHGQSCDALMKKADLALYQSKTSGRGTFHFFQESMETRAQARRTSELELRRALSLRQLELYYQPQVSLRNGRLVGFEALIRWRHPERGLISPAEFLPIAEEIGMIVPIGEWVLRTACREATKWPEEVVVAVNASPLQFETGRFADAVRTALIASGLKGSRLEIEITEGILLRNEDSVLATLNTLREMGVRIAMDDFGTGYASLSQLARFPFDKIKIDRSLSGFEGNNPKQRAIVRAIATLGASLGVATMAEGVETADQLARLDADGCSSVQGYFFSKPVPLAEVNALIARLCSDELCTDERL